MDNDTHGHNMLVLSDFFNTLFECSYFIPVPAGYGMQYDILYTNTSVLTDVLFYHPIYSILFNR